MSAGAISLDDVRLAARHARSRLHFHRTLATGSTGGQVLELPGVQAILVPARPRLALVNCVFAYDAIGSLAEALPQLDAAYARAGVAEWGAWTTDGDAAAAELLAGAGMTAGTPGRRMAGYIRPENIAPQQELDLEPAPSWQLLGDCNDRAYEVPGGIGLAEILAGVQDPACHLYSARARGQMAAALVAREDAGDCYLAFVATVPGERGAGIGSELVRHALREALRRGCDTASGESSPGAVSLYERVGARDLGPLRLWLKRPPGLP